MILCCGEAPVDLRAGGSPFDVAVGLARLGVSAAFLGGLPEDEGGRMLRARLAEEGVLGPDDPALGAVFPDLPRRLPRDVSAVHVGSPAIVREPSASAIERLVEREAKGRLVSLDPDVRPAAIEDRDAHLERLDRLVGTAGLVRASRDDLARIAPGSTPESVAAAWLRRGPGLVVVSLGADGAYGVGGNGEARVPAHPAAVVDTAGTGDAFTAALLAWLHHRALCDTRAVARLDARDIADALDFANHVAALSCGRRGASTPTLEEVRARR